jgi:hypothetical protein
MTTSQQRALDEQGCVMLGACMATLVPGKPGDAAARPHADYLPGARGAR